MQNKIFSFVAQIYSSLIAHYNVFVKVRWTGEHVFSIRQSAALPIFVCNDIKT